jgi:uncharacterized cofD-like protein
MSYRFSEGVLKGHSFGNIFLAALEKVTGNFVEGVEVASEILQVKGKVIPVTDNVAKLCIELLDGNILEGENVINHEDLQTVGIERIFYAHGVSLNESARLAILEADCIILGPGNYYCSLIPNCIVSGFAEALELSKAKIVFPVNLTNKQGHTLGWKVSQYVQDLESYLKKKIDVIVVNNETPSNDQVERYQLQEGSGVLVVDDMGSDARVIRAPLLSPLPHSPSRGDSFQASRGFIRHDSILLAGTIKSLL